MNRQQKQQEFTNAVRAGLQRNDPFQLAKVFRFNTESYVASSSKVLQQQPPVSFVDETGTDWSNILTLLLDANDALQSVSFMYYKYIQQKIKKKRTILELFAHSYISFSFASTYFNFILQYIYIYIG
jgi:hypothetical protein